MQILGFKPKSNHSTSANMARVILIEIYNDKSNLHHIGGVSRNYITRQESQEHSINQEIHIVECTSKLCPLVSQQGSYQWVS